MAKRKNAESKGGNDAGQPTRAPDAAPETASTPALSANVAQTQHDVQGKFRKTVMRGSYVDLPNPQRNLPRLRRSYEVARDVVVRELGEMDEDDARVEVRRIMERGGGELYSRIREALTREPPDEQADDEYRTLHDWQVLMFITAQFNESEGLYRVRSIKVSYDNGRKGPPDPNRKKKKKKKKEEEVPPLPFPIGPDPLPPTPSTPPSQRTPQGPKRINWGSPFSKDPTL